MVCDAGQLLNVQKSLKSKVETIYNTFGMETQKPLLHFHSILRGAVLYRELALISLAPAVSSLGTGIVTVVHWPISFLTWKCAAHFSIKQEGGELSQQNQTVMRKSN